MRKTRGGWGETRRASYFRSARFNTSPYYLRAWHRLDRTLLTFLSFFLFFHLKSFFVSFFLEDISVLFKMR